MKQIGSIEKIRKCNAKFDSSFVCQVTEMLAEYLNSIQAHRNNIKNSISDFNFTTVQYR
jgi:hypothetical protein